MNKLTIIEVCDYSSKTLSKTDEQDIAAVIKSGRELYIYIGANEITTQAQLEYAANSLSKVSDGFMRYYQDILLENGQSLDYSDLVSVRTSLLSTLTDSLDKLKVKDCAQIDIRINLEDNELKIKRSLINKQGKYKSI